MTPNTSKAVHSLILDANPILRNDPPVSSLLAQADQLYSIPAVIDEIRDVEARSRLETTLLPFLTLKTPKPASIKVITDFARRTGDLEVLSRPDIQILALAYELECERNHGDWRLRSMPGQKRTNGPPPASLTGSKTDTVNEEQLGLPETGAQLNPEHSATASKDTEEFEIILTEDQTFHTGAPEQVQLPVATSTCVGQEGQVDAETKDEALDHDTAISKALADTILDLPKGDGLVEAQASDEDDEEGWITPSNLKEHQEADDASSSPTQEEPKTMQVATMTADFAMQNVLLRMNLNLLSPNFQRIKQLKTWVLRCHACFDITKDMGRQFCKKCGKPTLLRVACSTDKDGNFQVHLKKNMQWNNRGNVFSIPKPVAGSTNGKRSIGGGQGGWGQNLILAEDQKEYVNAMTTERRRKEKDLMDEDYLPNILSGDRRGPQGRPKVGAGRNVNSKKRH